MLDSKIICRVQHRPRHGDAAWRRGLGFNNCYPSIHHQPKRRYRAQKRDQLSIPASCEDGCCSKAHPRPRPVRFQQQHARTVADTGVLVYSFHSRVVKVERTSICYLGKATHQHAVVICSLPGRHVRSARRRISKFGGPPEPCYSAPWKNPASCTAHRFPDQATYQ